MEQISLEDKVSNTLKWLANQIACIQVYKKWDEEFKKESLNDAWQKVQEQFKKTLIGMLLRKVSVRLYILEVGNPEEMLKKKFLFTICIRQGTSYKGGIDKKVANEKNTLGLRLIPLHLSPFIAYRYYPNVYWKEKREF